MEPVTIIALTIAGLILLAVAAIFYPMVLPSKRTRHILRPRSNVRSIVDTLRRHDRVVIPQKPGREPRSKWDVRISTFVRRETYKGADVVVLRTTPFCREFRRPTSDVLEAHGRRAWMRQAAA